MPRSCRTMAVMFRNSFVHSIHPSIAAEQLLVQWLSCVINVRGWLCAAWLLEALIPARAGLPADCVLIKQATVLQPACAVRKLHEERRCMPFFRQINRPTFFGY